VGSAEERVDEPSSEVLLNIRSLHVFSGVSLPSF